MLLLDVNILVYGYRVEMPQHAAIRAWLTELTNGGTAFGIPEINLSSFLRIVTKRPFVPPSPIESALDFCDRLIAAPNCLMIRPRETQWQLFDRLCRRINATGNIVQDAYLAAMALDQSCEWITADSDFARFPAFRGGTPWPRRRPSTPIEVCARVSRRRDYPSKLVRDHGACPPS